MTGDERTVAAASTVVVVALLGLSVLAFAPTATADHVNDSDAYAIEQGDQCVDVDPVVDESQTVEEFYDYRTPYPDTPNASTYSSYGTREYQEDNTSTLLLYEGSDGTSLVVVHEKLHENDENGTNGSSVTFNVTGISPGDGWAVEDDDYENQSDVFDHGDTHSEMTWVYSRSRTDGGAYRGLDGDFEIGIDPGFNEDANFRYENPGSPYGGWIHDWEVVTTTEDGFERVALDSLDEQVTIRPGYCAAPPNASLAVDDATPEVGVTNVTLDASESQSEAEIDTYEWDVTGNGTADRSTEEPVVEHTFEDTGERNVTVTVVAEDGQHDSATVPVTVEDTTEPTARIDAPDEATVGEELTISASGSEDNHRIERYEWVIENESNRDGETVSHAFDDPGEYEIELTVVDSSGNEDTTNATVNVTESAGPTATLQAPAEATVDETVTFDASGSEVGENATYEWRIDGNATATTEDPTYAHSFADPGEYEVNLTVVDGDGNSDTAAVTVEVAESTAPVDPIAHLEAPDEATVNDEVTLDASDSEVGENASYEWTVDGDDVPDADGPTFERSFDETGSYEVGVTVSDENGTDSTAITIEIVESLDASVAATPTNATVGETITFDGSDSTGDVTRYEWAFGDGTTIGDGDATTTHAYDGVGTYRVELTVTGDDGNNDTAAVTVEVAPASDPSGPTARLDAPAEATVGEAVTFDASASDAGENASYEWRIDGNATATTEDPTYEHAFATTGEHAVNLTVTDDAGSDSAEVTVAVEADDSGDDGGSGGGGGGGGYGPSPPAGPEPPASVSVDVEDGRLVVTAEEVDAGAEIGAEVPASQSVGSGAIELRSVEVVAGEDAETLTVAFEPTERNVPGRFSESSAFVPTASAELDTVTYEIAVDREALAGAGVAVVDRTPYAYDDEWETAAVTTEIEDGRVVGTAEVEGDAPIGVGAVGPVLFVRDVRTDGALTNGTVDLAAPVRNTGTERGEWTVPFELGGEVVAEPSVALAPGEETVVETTVPVTETSGVAVRAGGERRPLTVVEVTGVSTSPTEPAPNEATEVEAGLVNYGSATGEFEAELLVDGDVVASVTRSVAPGERTTVAFARQFPATGTYDLAVGNATETVRVSERDSFDGESSERTSGATPGFGVLAGLAAVLLGGVGFLARRQFGR